MKKFSKTAFAASLLFAAASAAAATPGFVVTPNADDDDEVAAKTFAQAQGYTLVNAADLAGVDPAETPVLWVMVDRVGIGRGVDKLPFTEAEVAALKDYSAKGGALYLSNFATQLADALGLAGDYGVPGVFGDGEGGSGNDVWTLNPVMGVMFGPGKAAEGQQGYYDRSGHEIYSGIEMTDPNNWGFNGVALIGPGQREDHNCLWDLNPVGKGDEIDVVANFEKKQNAQVLATWGHVQDHCVAGIAEFFAVPDVHGPVIANGLAAYEFNQNSGENPYQGNIEKLTTNIVSYLAKQGAGVESLSSNVASEAAWFTLQGVKVANPGSGIYIVVKDGKATKQIIK